jgi:hypothetical protein
MGIYHNVNSTVKFDPVERADIVRRYLDFYSGQKHDVRGFSYSGEQYTGPNTYARDDIRKVAAETGFHPHFTQVLGGYCKDGKRCGNAVQGGWESVCYDQIGCSDKTSIHERLHNGKGDGTPAKMGFGLGHSHILRKGKVINMGDNTCVMGSNDHIVGMVSPMICMMGWADPYVINESQTVLIAPVEMAGTHLDEHTHVVIRVKGSNDFWLSLRQDYPYPCEGRLGRLYVHEWLPKGAKEIPNDFPNATLRHEDMECGDEQTLSNGAMVKYLTFEDGIAEVEVILEDKP